MPRQTTSLQTLMHLVKGYCGTGILAMPRGFYDAGMLVASIGTPLIGLLCNHSIHLLIDTNDLICEKLDVPIMDYAAVGEKAFTIGPKRLRKYSTLSRYITALFLLMTQFGECCAYNLFIADNIKKFCMNLDLFSFATMRIECYLLILLPIMILLNFIKSIRTLSIASTCANLLQLTGLIIIATYLVRDIPPISSRPAVGDNIPLYFGTTIFTFEGISVTLSIYKAMKEPRNFGKLFGVINTAIVIVVLLYFALGFLGYLKFGDAIEPSITLSLPQEPLYEAVRFMYAIAILLTYPLQMYVPITMIWPNLKAKLQNAKKSSAAIYGYEHLFRSVLVIFTFALAAAIPRLDLIIALVGAISCSAITIIIPPILHSVAFWNEQTTTRDRVWLLVKNTFVTGVGLLGFAAGTYFSMKAIVEALSHGGHETSDL